MSSESFISEQFTSEPLASEPQFNLKLASVQPNFESIIDFIISESRNGREEHLKNFLNKAMSIGDPVKLARILNIYRDKVSTGNL